MTILFPRIAFTTLLLASICSLTAADRPPVTSFPTTKPRLVSGEVLRRIYAEVKTPFKYGVVIQGEAGELVDCPNVFLHQGRWYMLYVAIKDKVGYQTF